MLAFAHGQFLVLSPALHMVPLASTGIIPAQGQESPLSTARCEPHPPQIKIKIETKNDMLVFWMVTILTPSCIKRALRLELPT